MKQRHFPIGPEGEAVARQYAAKTGRTLLMEGKETIPKGGAKLPTVLGDDKEDRLKEIQKAKKDKQKERDKAVKESSKAVEKRRGKGDEGRRVFV